MEMLRYCWVCRGTTNHVWMRGVGWKCAVHKEARRGS
jgi:hypothetical protein